MSKEEQEFIPSDEEMRQTAMRLYEREGEIEIDPEAIISRGDDPGAYVQAWVWIYYNDVKPEDKE